MGLICDVYVSRCRFSHTLITGTFAAVALFFLILVTLTTRAVALGRYFDF